MDAKNDSDWNSASIDKAIKYGRTRVRVAMKEEVHVFVLYLTAFPVLGRDEGIRMLTDVYGRDMNSLGTLLTASDR